MFSIFSRIKEYYPLLGIIGTIKLILAKLPGVKPIEFSINRDEIKFPFNIRLGTSDLWAYEQLFGDEAYTIEFNKLPKIIVDAGANIGLASVYFANKFPGAKIIAIEPELSNFKLLQKNISQYENISAIQAALWNKNDTIDLIDPGLGYWAFQTIGAADSTSAKKHSKVKAITMDQLIREYNLEYIDILKMDIEGAEKEVLESADPWIDKIGVLIIELHERIKPGCKKSFYSATKGFDTEWIKGENIYKARKDLVAESAQI